MHMNVRCFVAGAVVLLFAGYSGSARVEPWLLWAAEPAENGEPRHTPTAQPAVPEPQAAQVPGYPGAVAKLTPCDAEALAKLATRVPLDFEEAPVTDVLEYLAHRIGIEIITVAPFDAADSPITIHARSVPAHTALELILDQANEYSRGQVPEYDFLIRDGAIFIVRAERAMQCRVYDCRALLAALSPDDPDALVDLIMESVEPESWMREVGPATVDVLGGMLVVRHRARVHRQIEELLGLLGANQEVQPR